MPSFGAFCPMPMRLGGSSEEGWSPESHARLANDLAAAKRACPLAVWTYTQSGASCVVSAYLGQNSTNVSDAPTAAVVSTGIARFTFAKSFTDPYGIERAIKATHGVGSSSRGIIQVNVTAPNVIEVRIRDTSGGAADGTGTVAIW